ncbi:MAG: hypothetical protein QHH13_00030 [Melioribacter sp.]|uniref:hypothetical protein n=1 Tax=Rosettibacter primus TaxID=3111523 RepID=UPI00247D9327|nr:hypothetical protein [Melioribacter sp.]
MANKYSRKKFFIITGIATIGVMLSQIIPLKNHNKKNNKKLSIKINPLAIKRNNKV